MLWQPGILKAPTLQHIHRCPAAGQCLQGPAVQLPSAGVATLCATVSVTCPVRAPAPWALAVAVSSRRTVPLGCRWMRRGQWRQSVHQSPIERRHKSRRNAARRYPTAASPQTLYAIRSRPLGLDRQRRRLVTSRDDWGRLGVRAVRWAYHWSSPGRYLSMRPWSAGEAGGVVQ